MSLNISLDPAGETLTPAAIPYNYRDTDPIVGLGSVRGDRWSIQSLDSTALRELASALLSAANEADRITREHAGAVA